MFELEKRIRDKAKEVPIQIMTHLVIGYPNLEANERMIEIMAQNQVDIIELQIPFSEPIADGPTIVEANQHALDNHVTTQDCFSCLERWSKKYPQISFLFMTYTNIVFRSGFLTFVKKAKSAGALGTIIPDLPIEHSQEYRQNAEAEKLSVIHILTPLSPPERIKTLNQCSNGMLYCVSRKGVTGKKTEMSVEMDDYIKRCRDNTTLPLGVGFGIKSKQDIDFLKGKVEVGVIGSALIETIKQHGVEALGPFIKSLR